ncbi:MAG: GNAT family N-acetyltransferase [Muribaculaceae bacterium]|nr:GNAT family N-acetyltransferase [Muribaculaceae bacterium]
MQQKGWTIRRYTPGDEEAWDKLVKDARNGTFLLMRGYMDYHKDRFCDCSLMVYDAAGRIVALFAAAEGADPGTVVAHPGLTYGGLILSMEIYGAQVCEIYSAITDFYRTQGYRKLTVRPVPEIYHRQPCEEEIYALVQAGAQIDRCLLSSAVATDAEFVLNKNTRRNIAAARRVGVTIKVSDNLEQFYDMLFDTLSSRHDAKPVHSPDELKLLADRFPDNIVLWTANGSKGELLAGTLVYLTDTCAHTQYIASTPEGREIGATAALLNAVAVFYTPRVRWIDFGTSNEQGGTILNSGLIRQKSGLGARGVVHLSLSLDL